MDIIKLFTIKIVIQHINDKKKYKFFDCDSADIVVLISFCAFDIVCGSLYITLIVPFTIGY